MELQCEMVQNVQVVHVTGRIDSATAEKFGQDIDMILGSGNHHMLLDLSAVPYINSAGLRVLLATAKSTKKHGGRFALSGLSDEVLNVIELAGFHKILTISPTTSDALSHW